MTTTTDIIEAITNGAADDDFDAIANAMKLRNRIRSDVAALNFKTGDRVMLQNLRPQYMEGLLGTIKGKNRTTFNVYLDEMPRGGRFSQDIRAKAHMLVKVDA